MAAELLRQRGERLWLVAAVGHPVRACVRAVECLRAWVRAACGRVRVCCLGECVRDVRGCGWCRSL